MTFMTLPSNLPAAFLCCTAKVQRLVSVRALCNAGMATQSSCVSVPCCCVSVLQVSKVQSIAVFLTAFVIFYLNLRAVRTWCTHFDCAVACLVAASGTVPPQPSSPCCLIRRVNPIYPGALLIVPPITLLGGRHSHTWVIHQYLLLTFGAC